MRESEGDKESERGSDAERVIYCGTATDDIKDGEKVVVKATLTDGDIKM